MKSILFLMGFLCSFSVAYADPWDCMSKEEAEALVEWLKKNPFILDYCDCCHDLDLETTGKTNVKATLLYIKSTEIIPCEYDPERVSIKAKYFVMSESRVDKKGAIKDTDVNNPTFYQEKFLITLNYHFVPIDNNNVRLYEAMAWLDYKPINCSGLLDYPNPGDFDDPIGKKYQKWATKMMNHWD